MVDGQSRAHKIKFKKASIFSDRVLLSSGLEYSHNDDCYLLFFIFWMLKYTEYMTVTQDIDKTILTHKGRAYAR